jgi:hypothetical protein
MHATWLLLAPVLTIAIYETIMVFVLVKLGYVE